MTDIPTTDLQATIKIKARELHNENCVKGCDRVIGAWWLVWAEQVLAAVDTEKPDDD